MSQHGPEVGGVAGGGLELGCLLVGDERLGVGAGDEVTEQP